MPGHTLASYSVFLFYTKSENTVVLGKGVVMLGLAGTSPRFVEIVGITGVRQWGILRIANYLKRSLIFPL